MTDFERAEDRLNRVLALAMERGDRVAIHSVRDRLNALRREEISHRFDALKRR